MGIYNNFEYVIIVTKYFSLFYEKPTIPCVETLPFIYHINLLKHEKNKIHLLNPNSCISIIRY